MSWCWIRHDWSSWGNVQEEKIRTKDVIAVRHFQRRTCHRCGIAQERTLKRTQVA